MVKFKMKGIEGLRATSRSTGTGTPPYTFFEGKTTEINIQADIDYFRSQPNRFEEVGVVKKVKEAVEKIKKKTTKTSTKKTKKR